MCTGFQRLMSNVASHRASCSALSSCQETSEPPASKHHYNLSQNAVELNRCYLTNADIFDIKRVNIQTQPLYKVVKERKTVLGPRQSFSEDEIMFSSIVENMSVGLSSRVKQEVMILFSYS